MADHDELTLTDGEGEAHLHEKWQRPSIGFTIWIERAVVRMGATVTSRRIGSATSPGAERIGLRPRSWS